MKKYLLLAGFMSLLASSQPAQPQADVIFGIMDHMMREGARQQQVNRDREHRQQQINRERQRQQQEIHRQQQAQVALVRRAQSALKTLGYYTLTVDGVAGPGTNGAIAAYQRAFELPVRSMDEHDIATLESRAQAGFRSLSEEREARALGFASRRDWQAAGAAGFSNAREWDEARSQGANNHSAWQAFNSSGFLSFREFEAAQARGFQTMRALQSAEQAGFDRAEEYEAFVQSGAADRETYLQQERRLESAAAARQECIEATTARDWPRASPACEQAAGALRSDEELLAARATTARQLSLRVTTVREKREQLQLRLDEAQGSLTLANAKFDALGDANSRELLAKIEAERNVRASELDELVQELAAADANLARAERGLHRAACYRESNAQQWALALNACRAALEADPNDQDSAAMLTTVEAEREAEISRAEAERHAIALSNARRDSMATLDTLDAFAASSGSFEQGLAISRAVVNLKAALEQEQAEIMLQAQGALAELLDQEERFKAFRNARKDAERAAQASALREAEGNAKRLEAFVRDHLARNVLSPQAADLLRLQASLEEALASDDPDRIVRAQAVAMSEFDQLGLGEAAREFTLSPRIAAGNLRDEDARAAEARLALATARERSALLLEELEDFIETGGRFEAAIPVARAIASFRIGLQGHDVAALEEARQTLEDTLGSEEVFATFRRRRAEAEAVATSDSAVTAAAWLNRKRIFIEDHIAGNPLDPNIDSLLSAHAEISDALQAAIPGRLALTLDEIRMHFDELGLAAAFERHVGLSDFYGPEADDVNRAPGGLAITALNAHLLDGEARDVLVLRNASGSAPHLHLNLRGDPVFDGGQADICWMHSPPPSTYAVKLAVQGLRAAGARLLPQPRRCQHQHLLQQDLVLLERGRFLEEDPIAAQALLTHFEDDQFQPFLAVSWSTVAEETTRQEAFVASLREELTAGIRDGVGFISLPDQGDAMCVVDDGGDEHAIALDRQLLTSAEDEISLHVPPFKRDIRDDAERIFARAGRGECAAIMASGLALVPILAGLARDGLQHQLLPIWFEAADVGQVREAVLANDEDRLRDLAVARQRLEAEALLSREQRETAENLRQLKEDGLRSTHAQEARGAFNDLQEVAFALLDGRAVTHSPAILFPEFHGWRQEHISRGWEFFDRTAELLDFGLADWSGRQLEAVIIRIQVKSRNQTLGSYSENCLVIGYLIDTEFERRRDSFEIGCADAERAVDDWRMGRDFVSRWVARLED